MCERKVCDKEGKRREFEKIKKEIDTLKPILDKISMEEVVKSIREDRDRR